MKNIIASLMAVLVLSFAGNVLASPREVQNNLENQTNFGTVGVTGVDQTGNPGYISFIAPNFAGVNFTYYMWVNGAGTVCVSSYPTISTYASFPTGNWNNRNPGMGCTVVGSQT